jgi:small subunit ribosomal protein S6
MSEGGFMRTYELMTIHRPELAEAEFRAKVEEIGALLTARDVKPSDTELWGKRRFAYEIDHDNEGYYSVISFETESTGVLSDLEKALTLSDAVIRHKIVRTDA